QEMLLRFGSFGTLIKFNKLKGQLTCLGRDRSVKNRDEVEAEEFEKYSIEQINALPKERRDTASQQLKKQGNVEFGQSNYEKAIRLYTQALAFNQDPVFYNNRAACYYNTHEFLKVIEDCNSALQMNPYYVKALNRRAMAYEKTSRFEESLHAACIIGDLRNENATASIDRLLKKVASIKAQEIIKNRIKRLPSSRFISSYLDSFRQEELEHASSEKSADDFFKLAEKLVQQHRYEEARKMYEEAINRGCTNMPKALNMRGTFTYLMGDSQNALVDFQRALELKPDYVQLHLAIAQYKSGSVTKGMDTFLQGLQKFPQSAEMHNYYGELLADQKRVDEAIEQFNKAIELQQVNFALPFVNKAMLSHHVIGDSAQAEEFCRLALEIEPESDIANTIMSEILFARGNLEAALQCLEKYQEVARTEAELQGILEYAEKLAIRYDITMFGIGKIPSTDELLAICVTTAKEDTPKKTKFAAEKVAVIKKFADIISSELSNKLLS
ncbi:16020_t:CDS:2, partial [Acaulospora colombiana]